MRLYQLLDIVRRQHEALGDNRDYELKLYVGQPEKGFECELENLVSFEDERPIAYLHTGMNKNGAARMALSWVENEFFEFLKEKKKRGGVPAAPVDTVGAGGREDAKSQRKMIAACRECLRVFTAIPNLVRSGITEKEFKQERRQCPRCIHAISWDEWQSLILTGLWID